MVKITTVEIVNTSTGKQYKKVTTSDGLVLSCWPDFIYYDKVIDGAEVEGVVKETGKYKNLVSGNLGGKPDWVKKESQIGKVMETKQRNIAQSMDRKELSILLSQANTFATEMTKTFYGVEPFPTDQEWRKKWIENKMWFLANHATTEDYSTAEAGRLIPS